MGSKSLYKNLANSTHPATLLYLVDISRSMEAKMPEGKSRMDVAKDAIQTAYTTMIQRSLRHGTIHSRYRVGMIAYTNELYDVYGKLGSIIGVDKLKEEGVPPLKPQKQTDMAKAFRYAIRLLQEDIAKWPDVWLQECPPPMVLNITDCEINEGADDPEPFARELQNLSVPDGNVLVSNIFITEQIVVPDKDNIKQWRGYRFNESTGDPFGDKLLAMSSPLPQEYAQIMLEQAGLTIQTGAAMMFPGISKEFIKTGFAMSMATGAQVKPSVQAKRPVIDES